MAEPLGSRNGGARLFLCGDVMTGRGIDRILPHPGDPTLNEPAMGSAEGYVRLAERVHGPIPRTVDAAYVWGEALAVLAACAPEARIVNLETAVTRGGAFWPKTVNYRMAPENAPVLTAAAIDCCVLANNHVMDFGRAGLAETLATLAGLGIATAGAGRDRAAAEAPAALPLAGGRRALVFGLGVATSGIPSAWAATAQASGVALLPDLSDATLAAVLARAGAARRPGDLLVASIHWGGNWGYAVSPDQVRFARGLVDGGFDVVHGHSAHHAKAIEIRRGRPILYGCGDFVTDYEGIAGYESFRGDLSLAYLPRFGADGGLRSLALVPFRLRRFRLERAPASDVAWLGRVLDRESRPFGTRVRLAADDALEAVPA